MTVSGQFTLDGTGTSGAIVTVIDMEADPSDGIGTDTTASDGTWSVDVGYTTTVQTILEYEDPNTGEVHKVPNKPFVYHETTIPAYIENKGVLWLPFGEGSGSTAADALGNGHDASITGAVWTSGTWVDDFALSYDGVDDVSTVDHHADLNPGSTDFAIAATVDITDTSTNSKGIASKYQTGGSTTPTYGIQSTNPSNGTFRLRARDSNGTAAEPQASAGSYPARLVGVRSGDDFTLYINGTAADTVNAAVGSVDNTDPFNIGAYWTSDSIEGTIDDVIVFNQALTSAEITDDFNRQPWS